MEGVTAVDTKLTEKTLNIVFPQKSKQIKSSNKNMRDAAKRKNRFNQGGGDYEYDES